MRCRRPRSPRALVAASAARRDAEAQRDRRRRRRLVTTTAVAVVVAIAAIVAGGIALRLRQDARDEAARAVEAQSRADAAAGTAAASEALAEQRAAEAADAADAERRAATRADEAADRAGEAAFRAETERLASTAEAIAATEPVLARQLAVTALDRSDEPATRQALAATLQAVPGFAERVAVTGQARCESMSSGSGPTGALLTLSPTHDGGATVSVTDLLTGGSREIVSLSAADADGVLNTNCAVPDDAGSAVLVPSDDELILVNADGSTELSAPADRVAFTNDQQAVIAAVAGVPVTLRVLDADDLRPISEMSALVDGPLGRPADVRATAADGVAVVADGSFRAVLVDLQSGVQRYLNPGSDEDGADINYAVDISDDGAVAVGLGERLLTVWQLDGSGDVDPTAVITPLGSTFDFGGTSGPSIRPRLNPSGTQVVLVTSVGIEVFDTSTGRPVAAPIEVTASTGAVTFIDDDVLAVLTAAGELLHVRLGVPPVVGTPIVDVVDGGLISGDGSSFTEIADDRWVVVSLPDGERTDHGDARSVSMLQGIATDTILRFDRASGDVERFDDGELTYRTSLSNLIVPTATGLGQGFRIGHGVVLLHFRDFSNVDNASGQVIAVDVDTGEVVGELAVPDSRRAELISADEFVHGDFQGGVNVRSFDGTVVERLPPFASSVQSFAGTQSGDVLVGLDDGTTVLWSRSDQRVVRRLDGPPLPVVSVQEASDGTIVVQHGSGQIVLWWPDSDDIGSEVVGPVGFTGLAQVVDERVMVAVAGRIVEIPLDVRGVEGDRVCHRARPRRPVPLAGCDGHQPARNVALRALTTGARAAWRPSAVRLDPRRRIGARGAVRAPEPEGQSTVASDRARRTRTPWSSACGGPADDRRDQHNAQGQFARDVHAPTARGPFRCLGKGL